MSFSLIVKLQFFWQLMRQERQIQSIKSSKNDQKVCLVALKHIFDQIRAIQLQESNEVYAVKEKFQPYLRLIQQDTNKIIQGYPISKEYLKDKEYFFEQEQKEKIEKKLQNNQKIDGYWLQVLQNFYGDQLTQADGQIARSIKAIITTQTPQFIDLTFQFGKNEYIEEGLYTKRCFIHKGSAKKVSGTINWTKKADSGIFYPLFSHQSQQFMQNALIISKQFIAEIVPYSIQHYIGGYECSQSQQLSSDSEDYQEELNKKVKQ